MDLKVEELIRGDLIEVHWVDILEDSVGDPAEAVVAPRITVGYFWEQKISKGVPVFVTTTTIDKEDTSQNGYCAYPEAVITRIKMIRRKRRPRKKKQEGNE